MMKQLLLAGAAGLATVSLAHAADVPMEAAEAVEYVEVCTEFGEGFFYIPGTDTCLKLSGHVRADYKFQDYDSDKYDTNTTNFGGNARLNLDARTATEFGTLRSFVELNTAVGSNGPGSARLGKACIQLGGLTAGYAASAFNFYDTNYANTIFAGYYTIGPHD
ncbi:MAG: porin [Labrys sp. (in: a-proteobacteria)]